MTEDSDTSVKRTTFRVLSLDGGGVRGLLSARILANIESYLSPKQGPTIPLGHHFDLIAGTSTGGIIALGLASGQSAQSIVSFYEKYIPLIFGRSSRRSWVRSLMRPKYRADTLERAVEEFFQNKTLNEVTRDVCITSVALQTGAPRFYKSGYLARNQTRLNEKLSDIALATSAAPTFLKAHSTDHSHNLVDGGMCANNPSLIAVVESLQFEDTSKRGTRRPLEIQDIALLSVGTGEQPRMPYNVDAVSNGGGLTWRWHIISLIMESQSVLAHHQTKFLLPKTNYLRINPPLKSPMRLDEAMKIEELKNLSDITAETEAFLKVHF